MGSMADWAADQEEEEADRKWEAESEKLVKEYGYGALRKELEVLYNNLVGTQQLDFVFTQLERLKTNLKLSRRYQR